MLPEPALSPTITAMSKKPYDINVQVSSRFLEDQSSPDQQHYVFAYTIRIANHGSLGARLLTRHWIVTDGDGEVREVRGDGVIGEQPWMQPGGDFEYTSGAVLKTGIGMMHGSYRMVADDGTCFEAAIPPFVLSTPRILH